MKKILVPLALIFLSINIFGQVQRKVAATNKTDSTTMQDERGGNGDFTKKRDKIKLLKELNLTKEQRLSLKEMRQANKGKSEAVMNDDALTAGQKQDKLKEIKKAGAYNLQQILSEEQRAKLKAIKREKEKL